MLLDWRRGARPQAGTRTARRTGAAVLALLLVLGAAVAAVLTARPGFAGDLRADSAEQVNLPEYGAQGSLIVRYRHGDSTVVDVELVNRGLLPITVTGVEPFLTKLGLATADRITVDGRPLPVTLHRGERAALSVHATFGNCEYFTERAIDPSTHARVTWTTLGVERSALIAYPRALLLRSPTIVDCPGRVLDRGAKQRNAEGTVTGRG